MRELNDELFLSKNKKLVAAVVNLTLMDFLQPPWQKKPTQRVLSLSNDGPAVVDPAPREINLKIFIAGPFPMLRWMCAGPSQRHDENADGAGPLSREFCVLGLPNQHDENADGIGPLSENFVANKLF
jgi:hypothetical protein